MKKQVISTILGTVALLGFTVHSFADTTTNDTSKGDVSFKAPTNPLLLTNVASFDFGENAISSADQTYNNIGTTNTVVDDLRGTKAGWTVTVSQANQFKNQSTELTGAQINVISAALAEGSADANVKNGVIVPGSGELTILDAKAGQGNGVTTEVFADNAVSLDVPGATAKIAGKYATVLTWTLKDVPANS